MSVLMIALKRGLISYISFWLEEDLDLETIAQEYFGLKLVTEVNITLYLKNLSNDATKYTVTFTAC